MSKLKYVFAAIGLAMLTGAALMGTHTASFIAQASRAQGTVTALVPQRSSNNSTTYRPIVRFQYGRQQIQFSESVASNPPSFGVGQSVVVLYRESNPYDAKIQSFSTLWAGALIVGGLGAVFLAVGGGMILVPLAIKRSDERLLHEGTPVEADFEGVRLNTSIAVNGRSPYRVTAQWLDPATSKVRVFESHNIWFDPTAYLKEKKLKVFLDTSNPKKYYIDLSFLPKLAS